MKTQETNSHPVSTALGAAAGGFGAGALAGTVAGPVGTVVGAVAGAVVGGLAGNSIAEGIDPNAEVGYWRTNYAHRPYVAGGASFDDYGPAYRYGVDSFGKYTGRTFDQAESEMASKWAGAKGTSKLTWDHAKEASRDSWQRVGDMVERATPGDSDRDGK